ncbi:ras-related protein Rab-34 isoform X2 [Harpegnathos saltator]|uniref:ras-related protein Rab-34 isoform X2 n=1 Tax=Harpegnathos saltator TaxID=610380 RepID=UPI000DBEDFDA|nr:ras-related protein Rab-34 isoform X2 [Harpegnathos saltator]
MFLFCRGITHSGASQYCVQSRTIQRGVQDRQNRARRKRVINSSDAPVKFDGAMLETRSAVYKMMKEKAHGERQITSWPPSFSSELTPYTVTDFGGLIKRTCDSKSLTLRICKVIVIGDVAVGKTALVNRWDTAGQERFKCIAASYYRGANVIMIVFDLGNLMSLAHCQQWLNEASRSNVSPYHIFLVGAKKDLLSQPVYEIIEKRAAETARRMRAEYWAISSRTGNGVSELFTRVAALSFHAMALREMQSMKLEPINIGSATITLKQQSRETEIKARRPSKCLRCVT